MRGAVPGSILVLAVLAAPAAAQDQPPTPAPSATAKAPRPQVVVQIAGASLFRSYCAACHGTEAHGDGPLADQLRVRPADLTLLARHEHGTFDREKVRRIVDGRVPVKGHGGPEMPVWGDAFKQAVEGYSEEKAAQRISALVDFLAEIQQKP